MFKNILMITIRNLLRQKFYSLINIAGLTLGITCAFFIFLFVNTELSYESGVVNADRIYRLCATNNMGGKVDHYCNAARPISPKMREIYDDVLAYTRLRGINGLYDHQAAIGYEDRVITSDGIYGTDSTFFDVFDMPLILGDKQESTRHPASIFLSEEIAATLFDDENPLGKTILIDNERPLTVRGVFRPFPGNSHIPFKALISWDQVRYQGEENAWYGGHVYQYLRMRESFDQRAFEKKLDDFYNTYMKERMEELNGHTRLFLQPFESVHLHSRLTWEPNPNGDINHVRIFIIIGIFLLIIACINYINLATARALRRSREVGMRKVFGSHRYSLIFQFLFESVTIAILAALLSFVLVQLLVPVYNQLAMENIQPDLADQWEYLGFLLLTGLVVGTAAGLYPAFYLSRYNPIQAIRKSSAKETAVMRKALIIFQFLISVSLMICTLTVMEQLSYIRNKDVGFHKDHMMVVTIPDTLVNNQIVQIKKELADHTGIVSAATAYNIPGTHYNRSPINFERPGGGFERMSCHFTQFDYEWLDLMGIDVVWGRNFQRDREQVPFNTFMMNQEAARRLEWADSLEGKRILVATDSTGQNFYRNLIGVFADFNASTLHEPVQPLVAYLIPDDNIVYNPAEVKRLYIRLQPEGFEETLRWIQEQWRKWDPNNPLQYTFLDDQLMRQYREEQRLTRLFGYFALITIFIACLGLFGLASFMAEQRTREIGIRKVVGASKRHIIQLLAKEFLVLVSIGFILAVPLAGWFMQQWLENFAFHVSLSLWVFLFSGLLSLLIALVTVSYHTLRVASMNPALSMRYE